MDFGGALDALKRDLKVHREGWNGKGMWICMEHAASWSGSRMRDFIYMKTVDDMYVPWVASQTDLLADDWLIATEES